jgi:hypothetical protein
MNLLPRSKRHKASHNIDTITVRKVETPKRWNTAALMLTFFAKMGSLASLFVVDRSETRAWGDRLEPLGGAGARRIAQ